ncbi:MAG: wax ester/triacylglycerol synthase family O-acyltransferase [Thermoanaerobaculia bacterium]
MESLPAAVPVAPVDRAWLRMDEPSNRMHIHGVLVLDGEVEREAVERAAAERLAVIPRFRDRIAYRDGELVWEPDPAFDVAHHVVEERLPDGAGDVELAAVLAADLPRPFPPDRPLWELRLIRGHADGTIVFARLHHAIGDGVALMTVLLALTDFPAADGSEAALSAEANPFFRVLLRRGELEDARREAERLMPETLRLMLAPGEAVARLHPLLRGLGTAGALARLVARPSDPPTPFKGPLGVDKRLAWTERLPLSDVKAIGRALGGTVNDVLNAAMVGGLRRYLEASAGPPPEDLEVRCAMPVSLRPLADMHAMGNRFGLVFLSLPVGIPDPQRRLGELHRRAQALRRSAEPLVVLKILEAMGSLPKRVQDWVVGLFGAKATGVFTNVPGPRQRISFAGRPIRDIFFWVPRAGRLGLGASIMSYNDHVRMGLGTDASLIPDPQRIVDGFHAEIEALLRLAR